MVQVIPRTYVQSMGPDVPPGPLYWRDEQSGELAEAINAYIDHTLRPSQWPAPTAAQLALIVDYCNYWIEAPCWRGKGIELLRDSAKVICTVEELRGWLSIAELYGVDPL